MSGVENLFYNVWYYGSVKSIFNILKFALNWGFVIYPFLNLSKSMKNYSILILSINHLARIFSSTSSGLTNKLIWDLANLLSLRFNLSNFYGEILFFSNFVNKSGVPTKYFF